MFTTKSGEKIFVIDAHVHLWDGSTENQKNIHGKQFIDCFYDYHKLSPKEYIWPFEKYQKYTDADFEKDVFGKGTRTWRSSIRSIWGTFTTMVSPMSRGTRNSDRSILTASLPMGGGIRAMVNQVWISWRRMSRNTNGKALSFIPQNGKGNPRDGN